MAVWEKDGIGTSDKWLRRVIEDFRSEGTKDMHSTNLLRVYMDRLSLDILKDLYVMDKEALLEILVNCYSTQDAFQKYKDIIEEYRDFIDRKNYAEQMEEEGRRKLKEHTEVELNVTIEIDGDWLKQQGKTEEDMRRAIELLKEGMCANEDIRGRIKTSLKVNEGWLDRDQIKEIEGKFKKREAELQEENSMLLDRVHDANKQCDEVYDQLQAAKRQIEELKARLFDAIEAGFEVGDKE